MSEQRKKYTPAEKALIALEVSCHNRRVRTERCVVQTDDQVDHPLPLIRV